MKESIFAESPDKNSRKREIYPQEMVCLLLANCESYENKIMYQINCLSQSANIKYSSIFVSLVQ